MLRSFARLAKGLTRWVGPRYDPSAAEAAASQGVLPSSRLLLWNAAALFHQSEQAKDYAVPNASWSPEMLNQFNKFMAMAKDGTWKKLPSYRNIVEHFPAKKWPRHGPKKDRPSRLFLRNLDDEGMGFEYAMFLNPSEKRMMSVFQLGPYLEGPPGYAHGGSIATILDSVLGSCAIFVAGRVLTANLSINYKSPVPLDSVVLVESKLDRIEGRKVFVTGHVQSVDGQTIHTEATGLFIQYQLNDSLQQQASSK